MYYNKVNPNQKRVKVIIYEGGEVAKITKDNFVKMVQEMGEFKANSYSEPPYFKKWYKKLFGDK